MAAIPSPGGVELDEYPAEQILESGLPPLPGGIDPGHAFPLAAWQDDRNGAVLYVRRLGPTEFEIPGEEYESEIEHLVKDPEGWIGTGGGGGDWTNPLAPPEDLLAKYVVFSTGVSASLGRPMTGCISPAGGRYAVPVWL